MIRNFVWSIFLIIGIISVKEASAYKVSEFNYHLKDIAHKWWQQLQKHKEENLNDENYEFFEKLAKKYGKIYKNDKDKQAHFETFINNLEAVKNNQNLTIDSQFFDLSSKEFAEYRLASTINADHYKNNPVKKKLLEPVAGASYWPIDIPGWIQECAKDLSCGLGSIEFPWDCMEAPDFNDGIDYPENVDWTTTNNKDNLVAVTPVKDQGTCGSCYSFSGTGALEGLMLREHQVTGNKTLGGHDEYDDEIWHGLSEQQVLDCMSLNRQEFGPFINHGCSGGWPANIFLYGTVKEHIMHSEDYPYDSGYTQEIGECWHTEDAYWAETAMKEDWIPGVCYSTKKNDEQQLERALYHHGPISVIVDASLEEFQLYNQGVVDPLGCSKDSLNHAMLLVGYGVENGEKYWKLKNSWGSWWGLDGYIKLARNGKNTCGVTSVATYITSDGYYD